MLRASRGPQEPVPCSFWEELAVPDTSMPSRRIDTRLHCTVIPNEAFSLDRYRAGHARNALRAHPDNTHKRAFTVDTYISRRMLLQPAGLSPVQRQVALQVCQHHAHWQQRQAHLQQVKTSRVLGMASVRRSRITYSTQCLVLGRGWPPLQEALQRIYTVAGHQRYPSSVCSAAQFRVTRMLQRGTRTHRQNDEGLAAVAVAQAAHQRQKQKSNLGGGVMARRRVSDAN